MGKRNHPGTDMFLVAPFRIRQDTYGIEIVDADLYLPVNAKSFVFARRNASCCHFGRIGYLTTKKEGFR